MANTSTETDPRRYFAHIGEERGAVAEAEPVCLYLEVTNRCNLLCTTCPRTFEALEPPGDMSWELFTGIVDLKMSDPHLEAIGIRFPDGFLRATSDETCGSMLNFYQYVVDPPPGGDGFVKSGQRARWHQAITLGVVDMTLRDRLVQRRRSRRGVGMRSPRRAFSKYLGLNWS